MAAEPGVRPDLRIVPTPLAGFDGEPTPENLRILISRVRELEAHEELLENDIKGKRLQIALLQKDRDQAALDAPERPKVDALHRCWTKACNRRRPLGWDDREKGNAAVRKLGFRKCLTAIVGAKHDPHTRVLRNGRVERYDDWELIFRGFGKVKEFARRAPVDWEPDPEKVAALCGVDVDRVTEWLG
jgi:hypothetical protein